MKQFIKGPLGDNARNLLRRAGYGELSNRHGQISYQRRLGGGQYPRFHAYVEDINGGMQLNLHVDQKQSSYGTGAAHGGEYDGPLVENEMARLVQFVNTTGRGPAPVEKRYPDEKTGKARSSSAGKPEDDSGKGFFGKLFG